MSDLHVVYRLEERVSPGVPERWASYSYPVSIYVAGGDIAEVRAEFREALEDMAAATSPIWHRRAARAIRSSLPASVGIPSAG